MSRIARWRDRANEMKADQRSPLPIQIVTHNLEEPIGSGGTGLRIGYRVHGSDVVRRIGLPPMSFRNFLTQLQKSGACDKDLLDKNLSQLSRQAQQSCGGIENLTHSISKHSLELRRAADSDEECPYCHHFPNTSRLVTVKTRDNMTLKAVRCESCSGYFRRY